MRKRLNDTKALAAKPVLETCNPDYSGFRNSTPQVYGLLVVADEPAKRPGPPHSLRAAVASLERD